MLRRAPVQQWELLRHLGVLLQVPADAPLHAAHLAPPRMSQAAKQKARKSTHSLTAEQPQAVQPADTAEQVPPLLSSPRKALRKRVPKRKQAPATEQPDQAQPSGSGPLSQLLNLPINERALEHLLAGEWQVGFPRVSGILELQGFFMMITNAFSKW